MIKEGFIKVFYFCLIFFLSLSIFISPPKVKAAASDIVLNEIMYDLPGTDDKHEWVEIYNGGSESVEIITGSGSDSWRFFDGDETKHTFQKYDPSNNPCSSNTSIVPPQGYLILSPDPCIFRSEYPDFTGLILKVAFHDLNNTSDTLKLSADNGNTWFSEISYTDLCGGDGDGSSLELPFDSTFGKQFLPSQKEGGTPGLENSEIQPLPDKLKEFSKFLNFECEAIYLKSQVKFVTDGDTVEVEDAGDYPSKLRLLGIDSPEHNQLFFQEAKNFVFQKISGQEVEILISVKRSEQKDQFDRTLALLIIDDEIVNLSILKEGLAKRFAIDNLLINKEEWDKIENEARNQNIGIWSNLVSGKIIISEILPDPVGKDSDLEWIELQNISDSPIDLSGWILDKKTQYQIPEATILGPGQFLVLKRTETKISLSNDGDSLDLYFPDGTLADSVAYPKAPQGQSYAKLPDGIWQWTLNPTPGAPNVLVILKPKPPKVSRPKKEPKEEKPEIPAPIIPEEEVIESSETQDTIVTVVSKKVTITSVPQYVVLVKSYQKYLPSNHSILQIENPKKYWYILGVKLLVSLADVFLILLLGDYLWKLSQIKRRRLLSWEEGWRGG